MIKTVLKNQYWNVRKCLHIWISLLLLSFHKMNANISNGLCGREERHKLVRRLRYICIFVFIECTEYSQSIQFGTWHSVYSKQNKHKMIRSHRRTLWLHVYELEITVTKTQSQFRRKKNDSNAKQINKSRYAACAEWTKRTDVRRTKDMHGGTGNWEQNWHCKYRFNFILIE